MNWLNLASLIAIAGWMGVGLVAIGDVLGIPPWITVIAGCYLGWRFGEWFCERRPFLEVR